MTSLGARMTGIEAMRDATFDCTAVGVYTVTAR